MLGSFKVEGRVCTTSDTVASGNAPENARRIQGGMADLYE